MTSNVLVERRPVAQAGSKSLYPNSSIPSDDQRRRCRASAPTKVRRSVPRKQISIAPPKKRCATNEGVLSGSTDLKKIGPNQENILVPRQIFDWN
jgi:hypothetical protein